MTFRMNGKRPAAALCLAVAACGGAAITANVVAGEPDKTLPLVQTTGETPPSLAPDPQDGPLLNEKGLKPFEVHEWGVFSVYPTARYANVDMAKEWAELPKWMYRSFPSINLPTQPMKVRKPIVYFHWADPPLPKEPFTMRIRFPQGRPIVWYPTAADAVVMVDDEGSRAAAAEFAATALRATLTWRFWLTDPYPTMGVQDAQRPSLPVVPADHWYARARQVKSDPLFVYRTFGRHGPLIETEQFVYYDGVMAPLPCLRAKRDDQGAIYLENSAPYAIHDLYAVEMKKDEAYSEACVPLVPVGQKIVRLNWRGWSLREGTKHPTPSTPVLLLSSLVKAGLNQDEAQALVDIWKPAFFGQEGLTLIYRLPQKEYDRVTTMALDPAPAKLVRVGLVHQPHAEPELPSRVAGLITRLAGVDAGDVKAATMAILDLGGAALEGLEKARVQSKDETRLKTLDALIRQIDISADPAFRMPKKSDS